MRLVNINPFSRNILFPGVWVVVAIFCILVFISSEPLAILYAGVVLVLGGTLLWRPGESPILLFVFFHQYIQSSIKLFQVGLGSKSWAALSEFGGNIESASYLSLTALLFLAAGMRWGAGKCHVETADSSVNLARKIPIKTWFALYLAAFLLGIVFLYVARLVPSLRQPLMALGTLKWAFYFLLTYASFHRPLIYRGYWLLAFCLEFLLGFGGYFSDFKLVLFYSLLGVASAGIKFTPAKSVMLSLLLGFTFFIAVIWTAVKSEYREYISSGEQAQVVKVNYTQSMSKLISLTTSLDSSWFSDSVDMFLARLAYVDYFAASLDYVPAVVDHTRGGIWLDALSRPFMPRLFFPGKTSIDDSVRTSKYTGMKIAGRSRGTSISLGYIGESYIDFGRFGMMLPILFYGWMLGRIYRWLVVNAITRGLLGMGFASAILMSSILVESSITKIFGGLAASVLVAWLLIRFILPLFRVAMETGNGINKKFRVFHGHQ